MRNRTRYGKDWKERSRAAKEQAGWCCTQCGVQHGTPRYSYYTGREWPVYLQAHHRDHDPENPTAILIVVCPRCHWRFFRPRGVRPAWVIESLKHRKMLQERGVTC
jgi:predicted HNH restriction endonuclease